MSFICLYLVYSQRLVCLLCLYKTWLTQQIADVELGIEVYTFHRRDRGYKERGWGLGIYVRNDLLISRRFDLEQSDIESLWVEVHSSSPRIFGRGILSTS